jgi:putative ABC transport system permease protein
MSDLKFACRQLLKNPGFTAVAVLVLALGMGANTAILTIVNVVMMGSLHVKSPGELVRIFSHKGASFANSGTTNV